MKAIKTSNLLLTETNPLETFLFKFSNFLLGVVLAINSSSSYNKFFASNKLILEILIFNSISFYLILLIE